jgi:hypothetical protein
MKIHIMLLATLTMVYSSAFAKTCKFANEGGLIGYQYSKPFKVIVENKTVESYKTSEALLNRAQQLVESNFCTVDASYSCNEKMEFNSIQNFSVVSVNEDLFFTTLTSKESRSILAKLFSIGICVSEAQ